MNQKNNHYRGGRSAASRTSTRHSGNRKNGRRHYGNKSKGRHRPKGPSLDPQLFVKKAENVVIEQYQPTHFFTDFSLEQRLEDNIVERGYTHPTAIQDQAIPQLLAGHDLVGIADTGSGKTAAFLIPLIHKVLLNSEEKTLVVAPTRELAMQIKDELKTFIKGTPIHTTLCIGGASLNRQADSLRQHPHFVIATPGRLLDLQNRRKIKLHQYKNVVLDEVDRMLDMGFIHDVRKIISHLPNERQSLFFSATMPKKTAQLMQEFLTNPVTVSVKTGNTAQNVDQDIVHVNPSNKVDTLHDLLITDGFDKVIVFGRTKWGIKKLEKTLSNRGFKVASLHGNKTQKQRQNAVKRVRGNEVQVLLATDVASRGLDIDDITHVINYDVPESYDDYVHRIGRTGRAGKKGAALTFIHK